MAKQNEVGALWTRQGRSGQFFSGFIEINGQRIDVVGFNNSSQNPKAPAIRLLQSTPREQSGGYQRSGQQQTYQQPVYQQQAMPQEQDINVEDIPF